MGELLNLITQNKGIITTVLTVISFFGLRNIITFLTSNALERQFYTKENKLIFTLLNYLFLFIIFPILIFISWSKSSFLYDTVLSNYMSWILSVDFVVIAFLILRKNLFTKKNVFNLLVKMRLNKIILNSKLLPLSIFLFLILTIFICGLFNSAIILEAGNFKLKILVLIVYSSAELYIIFLILHFGIGARINKPILVNIKMDNNDFYENYFIYYPTKNNFLLIGKESIHSFCNEPVLIPLSKIVSCKQVNNFVHSKKQIKF